MKNIDPITAASRLYFALLNKRFLPNIDPLVSPYIESEDVRSCVNRLAKESGVYIVKKEKYIHMLVNPNQSIYANSLSELRKRVRGYDSKIDLFLLGMVWMVLFAEADTEISSRIKWEDKGIGYHELEEQVTQVLFHWEKIDSENDGRFSEEWSLAVKQMNSKWRNMQVYKQTNGRVSMVKGTRFGLIDSAMKELQKDKMLFIREFSSAVFVTPTEVFYERLKARFGHLGYYKERYDVLKALIEDTKDQHEMDALYSMENEIGEIRDGS